MADGTVITRSRASRARPGREEAFARLYREHYRFVWRLVRRLGVPESSAEDALQEVFVTAHRRLHTFAGRGSLRGWLAGITRRVAFRWRRAADRRERKEDALGQVPREGTGLDEWLERHTAAVFLEAFVSSLDPPKREAFVLCELEGMRGREMARALGINPNTASARLRAARQALARVCEQARCDGLTVTARSLVDAHEREQPPAGAERRSWALLAVHLGTATKSAGVLGKLFASGMAAKAALGVAAVATTAALTFAAAPPQAEDVPEVASTLAPVPAAMPSPDPEPAPPRVRADPPARTAASDAAPSTLTPPPDPKKPARARRAATSDFPAQLALVEEAQDALARGRTAEAERMAAKLLREHPRTSLANEAATLRIDALCKLGDRAAARRVATTHFGARSLEVVARRCGPARQ